MLVIKRSLILSAVTLLVIGSPVHAQDSDFNRATGVVKGDVIQKTSANSSHTISAIGSSYSETGRGKTDATAYIGGDLVIENTASARSDMATLIGSIDTRASNPDIFASASIEKNVHVKNSGAEAVVYTELGSVNSARMQGLDAASGGIASQTAKTHIEGSVDVNNSGREAYVQTMSGSIAAASNNSGLLASSNIGGDLVVSNTGDKAIVITEIGSIDGTSSGNGKFKDATARADIKGSVIHKNTASNTRSSVLIGSLR